MLSGCCQLLAVSHVWESKPVGCTRQAPFLNAAVLLGTSRPPLALRAEILRRIEDSLGRTRACDEKNVPRTIDIDLVLFDTQVIEGDGWRLPDPAIVSHSFVAVPLAELSPNYIHPTAGRTLAELAHSLLANCPPIWLRPDVELCRYCEPPMEFVRSLPPQMQKSAQGLQPSLIQYLPF